MLFVSLVGEAYTATISLATRYSVFTDCVRAAVGFGSRSECEYSESKQAH